MKKWFLKYQSSLYWVLIITIFGGLAYLQYYGLLTYKYLVPPGDDPANHLIMIQPLYDHAQSVWEVMRTGGYPPGFHLLIANLAHLFNVTPLKAILWFYPSILILTSLSVFFLCYRIFGRGSALIALLLYAFVARTPAQLLNDGGYPNLLAASFLLPIFIIFFLEIFQPKWGRKILGIIFSLIFAGLILFTHHLSTFYLIGIVLLSLPCFTAEVGILNKWSWKKWLVLIISTLVLMSALVSIFISSEIFNSARNLISGMVEMLPKFPYFKPIGTADPNAIWPLNGYPYLIGKPIAFFGLLGIFTLPFFIWGERKKYLLPYIILTIWVVMLFLSSRMTFVSNPERMSRDLVVPLSILAGATIVQIFTFIKRRITIKYLEYFSLIISLAYLIFLSLIPFQERLKGATEYQNMVRFTDADYSATRFLKSELDSGRVLVGSFDYYIPNFLSNWDTHYLYSMPESSRDLVFDPSTDKAIKFLKQYNYLYFVSNQAGWIPPAVRFDYISKYIDNPNFEFVLAEQSTTNEVLLFKVIK